MLKTPLMYVVLLAVLLSSAAKSEEGHGGEFEIKEESNVYSHLLLEENRPLMIFLATFVTIVIGYIIMKIAGLNPVECIRQSHENKLPTTYGETRGLESNSTIYQAATFEWIRVIKENLSNVSKSNKQGIIFAFGVTNAGCSEENVKKIKEEFNKKNFIVFDKIVDKPVEIKALAQGLARVGTEYLSKYKYIAFYYCGHGGVDQTGALYLKPELFGNEHPNPDYVHFREDIMIPFETGLKDKCLMFFLDCCRNIDVISDGSLNHIKFTHGNYIIAHSTVHGESAIADGWTKIFCEYLAKDNKVLLSDILEKTQTDVRQIKGQQAIFINQLSQPVELCCHGSTWSKKFNPSAIIKIMMYMVMEGILGILPHRIFHKPTSAAPKLMVPDWYMHTDAAHSISAPCIRIISTFSKSNKFQRWFSLPFYAGSGGYNLRLKVEIFNKYLSVGVCIAEGDNDDSLRWPFRGTLKVTLLNWTGNQNHIEHTFSVTSANDSGKSFMRVVAGKTPGEISNQKFISINQLDFSPGLNTQFLSDGNLCFEITDINVDNGYKSSMIPNWAHSQLSNYTYGVLPVFRTVENFKLNKQLNAEVPVDPFYTARGGFKVAMSVYPNGNGPEVGNALSVSVYLTPGENDDELKKIPFNAIFNVQLLNWKEDSDHAGYTFLIDTGNSKITFYGVYRYAFITHKMLFNFSSRNLIENDMLCFKIDYFTLADKSSVPVWCDIKLHHSNVIPCARNMDGYTAHKITHTRWLSEPFYTSERGYSLQLIVYTADKYSAEKYMNLFVGIRLMMGKYDDELNWPMNISVTVELQNWLSDNNHIKEVIPHYKAPIEYRNRVDSTDHLKYKGVIKENIGTELSLCINFVSHAQLEFPESRGINYFDADRLCFKIIQCDWVDLI